MKVLLINGSPKKEGCTYTALRTVEEELIACGIETEIIWVGSEPIRGCTACGVCAKTGSKRCVFDDDSVNRAISAAEGADGFVFGSPVHYASASGAVTSFLDRMFYAGGSLMAFKPCACIASCRRGGATAALEQLNKYPTICNMPLISSNYWNMVHGNTPDEVLKDEEGIQTMQQLGRNMAWILKSIESGRQNGVEMPKAEPKIKTNYIR